MRTHGGRRNDVRIHNPAIQVALIALPDREPMTILPGSIRVLPGREEDTRSRLLARRRLIMLIGVELRELVQGFHRAKAAAIRSLR